jgi:hypothetical protein
MPHSWSPKPLRFQISNYLQLNDFDVGEWSPEKSDAKQSAVKDGREKKV